MKINLKNTDWKGVNKTIYADDMTISVELTKKIYQTKWKRKTGKNARSFQQVSGYKINIKPLIFLYVKNECECAEPKMKNVINKGAKGMKCLVIYLTTDI